MIIKLLNPIALLLLLFVVWTNIRPADAQTVIRVGLAVANNVPYAPVYVAENLGYFQTGGIDIQVTEYSSGTAAQQALIAGAADIITYSAASAALAISDGAKEKVVGVIEAVPLGWDILVNPSSPIMSVADLSGKKLGITAKGSTTDVIALWALDVVKIQARVIPLGGATVSAMRFGQVDASVVNPPTTLKLIGAGHARSILDFGTAMPPTLPDVWVASEQLMAQHPKELSAYLGAFYKALAYMKANRGWSVQFLENWTQQDPKTVGLSYDLLLQQPDDGTINPSWLANSLSIAAKAWNRPNLLQLQPQQIFTNSFVVHG